MNFFEFKDNRLFAEDLDVSALAEEYGTPLYIYSAQTLRRHFTAFDTAFENLDHLICYSAKANSNINILRLLGDMGAGLDIVSGGELFRGLAAGIDPSRIVYSGVGKRDVELAEALKADILIFNVESVQELERLNVLAGNLGRQARVSLRVNPDVDPKTHPYISTGLSKNKFGLPLGQAMQAYMQAKDMPNIEIVGLDCHVGSQLTSISPFKEVLDRILAFADQLAGNGIAIKYLDLGGGLGITYNDEEPPLPRDLGDLIKQELSGRHLTLIVEPGRAIVGNAGILVTRVVYTKETPDKHFIITDAAMNDLMRPALYQAYHNIIRVEADADGTKSFSADIVGPICESADFLGKDRRLGQVRPGELLAVCSAGAYGFSMSSQYNSRPRAAEVLVDGATASLIRKRESYEDLIYLEK